VKLLPLSLINLSLLPDMGKTQTLAPILPMPKLLAYPLLKVYFLTLLSLTARIMVSVALVNLTFNQLDMGFVFTQTTSFKIQHRVVYKKLVAHLF